MKYGLRGTDRPGDYCYIALSFLHNKRLNSLLKVEGEAGGTKGSLVLCGYI